MPEPVSASIRELLVWVCARPRTYGEAMEAWKSTCPRHTVWEDALIDGLIQVADGRPMQSSEVTLTARGQAILAGTPVEIAVR